MESTYFSQYWSVDSNYWDSPDTAGDTKLENIVTLGWEYGYLVSSMKSNGMET